MINDFSVNCCKCGEKVFPGDIGYVSEYCCDGRDCGCMGMRIDEAVICGNCKELIKGE